MTDRLKLAAFDLDGTLLDSIPAIVIGIGACWETLGFPEVAPDQIKRIIGLPWEKGIEVLMPGAGTREVDMIKQYYGEVARGERSAPERPAEALFEGVPELLAALEDDGYVLAIVTSRSGRRVHDLLGENGLEDRFVSIQTADLGPGKPNPFLLNQAMGAAGVEAVDTVMIGDTTYDVQTGRNAGTGAIGVTWGVHPADELEEAGAHHIAHEVDHLVGYIDGLIDKARSG